MLQKTQQLTISAIAALFHLVLLFIIQFENYAATTNHSQSATDSFFTLFWFMQAENGLFALLMGTITFIALSISSLRWPGFIIITCINLYAIINQVGYKMFFSNFHPSMLEDGNAFSLSNFSSSFMCGKFIFS